MSRMINEANRKWWVLIAMTGALSMIMLDMTVVSVALPSIQDDLELTQTQLQWVMNAYLLSLAALVPFTGRLADMFNRVAIFILGVVIFVGASITCALAIGETSLILSRAVEGVGAALMIPPSQTLVLNAFDVKSRGRAMGVYAGVSMVFLSLGPLIGGLCTEIDWRLVFWINLPVGIVTILVTLAARPDGRVTKGQRLDWLGTATLVPGLCGVVLGLMQATTWGWTSPLTLLCLIGGGLLVVAFVFIEPRVRDPLLELRLFKGRNFVGDSVVLFFIQFALMGLTVFGAIYVQNLLGYSPIQAGLSMLPLTLPLLVAAPLAGRAYDRIGPRVLATTGAAIGGLGMLWNAYFLHELDYWILIPGYIALGLGVGMVTSPTNTDALNAASADLRGQASGAIQAVRQIGGTVGLAVLGTVVASVEKNRLIDSITGLGGTEQQAEKISGILSQGADEQAQAAAQLPAAQREQVVSAAQDAIVDGIAASYWIAGGVILAAAVVAFLVLQHVEYDEAGPAAPPV